MHQSANPSVEFAQSRISTVKLFDYELGARRIAEFELFRTVKHAPEYGEGSAMVMMGKSLAKLLLLLSDRRYGDILPCADFDR